MKFFPPFPPPRCLSFGHLPLYSFNPPPGCFIVFPPRTTSDPRSSDSTRHPRLKEGSVLDERRILFPPLFCRGFVQVYSGRTPNNVEIISLTPFLFLLADREIPFKSTQPVLNDPKNNRSPPFPFRSRFSSVFSSRLPPPIYHTECTQPFLELFFFFVLVFPSFHR